MASGLPYRYLPDGRIIWTDPVSGRERVQPKGWKLVGWNSDGTPALAPIPNYGQKPSLPPGSIGDPTAEQPNAPGTRAYTPPTDQEAKAALQLQYAAPMFADFTRKLGVPYGMQQWLQRYEEPALLGEYLKMASGRDPASPMGWVGYLGQALNPNGPHAPAPVNLRKPEPAPTPPRTTKPGTGVRPPGTPGVKKAVTPWGEMAAQSVQPGPTYSAVPYSSRFNKGDGQLPASTGPAPTPTYTAPGSQDLYANPNRPSYGNPRRREGTEKKPEPGEKPSPQPTPWSWGGTQWSDVMRDYMMAPPPVRGQRWQTYNPRMRWVGF